MKAMVLKRITKLRENRSPLELVHLPDPVPDAHELRVRVSACGVCHTELDEIEGRSRPPVLPVVPGHQAVGLVDAIGRSVTQFRVGDRVGIAWIFSACGKCSYCQDGNENLCTEFRATGRDANGGYAEYLTVSADFAYHIPDAFSDSEAAPLLCAGAIGFRSLRLCELANGSSLGLTGFGASGHLVLKMAAHIYPESRVFVFARNPEERAFALELGAIWAGNTGDESPEKLAAIIDTTPVWKPVVEALKNLAPAGRLVINAIRKQDDDKQHLMRLDYPEHLWWEKEIKSVANVTRRDVREFLQHAATFGLKAELREYALEDANTALVELQSQSIRGAKVLRIG